MICANCGNNDNVCSKCGEPHEECLQSVRLKNKARALQLLVKALRQPLTKEEPAPGNPGAATMNDYSLLPKRIEELVAQHGSLRAAARVLETDCGYLSRLRSGEKVCPDAALLKKMGLVRVVRIELMRSKP